MLFEGFVGAWFEVKCLKTCFLKINILVKYRTAWKASRVTRVTCYAGPLGMYVCMCVCVWAWQGYTLPPYDVSSDPPKWDGRAWEIVSRGFVFVFAVVISGFPTCVGLTWMSSNCDLAGGRLSLAGFWPIDFGGVPLVRFFSSSRSPPSPLRLGLVGE